MERYRSLLEKYVELYNAGDLDGVMDLYAEDSVQLMPDGTFEGRSAIRDRLGQELAAFSDLAHRYISYVEEDDAFADEWVFVGTHTGPVVLPDGTEVPARTQNTTSPITACSTSTAISSPVMSCMCCASVASTSRLPSVKTCGKRAARSRRPQRRTPACWR